MMVMSRVDGTDKPLTLAIPCQLTPSFDPDHVNVDLPPAPLSLPVIWITLNV